MEEGLAFRGTPVFVVLIGVVFVVSMAVSSRTRRRFVDSLVSVLQVTG